METIFIAGHNGMVGSALRKELEQQGLSKIITVGRQSLDLTSQAATADFIADNKITQIYIAAGKVGGIKANSEFPVDFLYENLMIAANIIHAAHQSGVNKLLYFGSSCAYPKLCEQPIREEYLLAASLEPTNEAYAIAKIVGMKLCEAYRTQYGRDYRTVVPTNAYGPGDNFDPDAGHVIPSLMRRFHDALSRKEKVVVWGSGKPLRDFIFVDDLVRAAIFIMNMEQEKFIRSLEHRCCHINIGTGNEVSIRDIAESIAKIVGYDGDIEFDVSRPDGMARKVLDVTVLDKLGWRPSMTLNNGLKEMYDWFLKHRTPQN